MNCLNLMGKVKEAEMKSAKTSGKPYLTLTVLTKKPAWENSTDLDEIPITAFGKTAEKAPSLKAGDFVEVRARVISESRNGNNGGTFVNVKVIADEITKMTYSGQSADSGSGSGSSNPPSGSNKKPPAGGESW